MDKRVAHISSVHLRSDVRIFSKECISLSKSGYTVFLVVADGNGDEVLSGVSIMDAGKRRSNRFFRMLFTSISVVSRAYKLKCQVYHFHDPELMPFMVLLKWFSGAKIVYDVHEDYRKQILTKPYLAPWLRVVAGWLAGRSENLFSMFYNGIVTVTETISQNFAHHKNVVCVKNYPLLDELTKTNSVRESASGKTFRLIYVGGLFKERGISTVINALAFTQSRDIRLTLCGLFSPSEYENEVRKLPGFELVDFLGWKTHGEIKSLLEESDAGIVCLHPLESYQSSLPVKMFEYMYAGLPVIASDFALWREIIDESKCGLCVDPLAPIEIAKAIDKLYENRTEAKQMGENGKQKVLSEYNWNREEEKLLSFYSDLIRK